MAGAGLQPRHGTALLEAPTLFAPDLELHRLGPGWEWMARVEVAIALCFLFGVYVRAAAAVLLALAVLGLAFFGADMLAYLGLVAGAALYLLMQGAGSYYVPMPALPGTGRVVAWLTDQPRARAQWLLQTLGGLNLTYLGVSYKALQPNLMVGVLQTQGVPTFGLEPAALVRSMALVETLSGVLITAGMMMRFLSLFLFASFVVFSFVLGEGVVRHIMFYGLLVSFITNGDGRWRRPVAHDKPGRIVILGGGFAGIQCAMRLERLLGQFTNVTVTLVHRVTYFLFQPLLPEVVGGAVQPGSIAGAIRRLCPRTRFLQGDLVAIAPAAKELRVTLSAGQAVSVEYDQLVVAVDPEVSYASVPGLLEHALPIMTIGDALFLLRRIHPARNRTVRAYMGTLTAVRWVKISGTGLAFHSAICRGVSTHASCAATSPVQRSGRSGRAKRKTFQRIAGRPPRASTRGFLPTDESATTLHRRRGGVNRAASLVRTWGRRAGRAAGSNGATQRTGAKRPAGATAPREG